MNQDTGRRLDSLEVIEEFLKDALGFNNFKDYKGLVSRILTCELIISRIEETPTLSSQKNRHSEYRDKDSRWSLRRQIIDELLSEKRLDKDDDMKLGAGGGALPKKSTVRNEKQAFIVIGPPASGKSGIAETIADDYGAVIADPDYAKRKLPEYEDEEIPFGSPLVHLESSAIIYGFDKASSPSHIKPLIEICLDKSHNLVIPTIGSNYAKILSLAKSLKQKRNYDVHLILTALSKKKATIRAVIRFFETRRYVPLSLIFDVWGNEPWLTYFYLKCKHKDVFKSFGAVSTDVAKGAEKIGFDVEGNSPVSKLKFEELNVEW